MSAMNPEKDGGGRLKLLPARKRAPSPNYTIRELRLKFGVTARALRHYEDLGMLKPARRGTTRVYSTRDHARLSLIVDGRRVGFSLAEIGEWLDLYDEDAAHVAQMASSILKFRRRVVELEREQRELQLATEGLRQACAAIEGRLSMLAPDIAAALLAVPL